MNENIFTIRVWWALIEEVDRLYTSAMAAGAAGVLRLYFRFGAAIPTTDKKVPL